MIYGHDGTWHSTEHLDVEVDESGKVVAVWFRCMALPFRQSSAGYDRAVEMEHMYKNHVNSKRLLAVDVK